MNIVKNWQILTEKEYKVLLILFSKYFIAL